MSQKKIIFFIIVGLIVVSLIAVVAYISQQKKTTNIVPKSLKIWITDGNSDAYEPIIADFKKYAPEYSKTNITVEKQTNDADRYRTLVLSTLSEGSGPDIFMVHAGEDAILETKINPIPSSILDFSSFDTQYDDIFQGLISATGSGKDKITTLKGVPLSYEALGVFYNKSLIREIPKTWNELESLYNESTPGRYPSNLGLGPTYTPNMGDILPLWLIEAGASNYRDISTGENGITSYLDYGDIRAPLSSESTNTNLAATLREEQQNMVSAKVTTIDMFMRGDIAMIVGYPSLILDLEKAHKRAGSASSNSVILTGRIPATTSKTSINIGRYTYFGISKYSENGQLSIKFLEYLMTAEAQRLYMNAYPYLIPAQSSFYAASENSSLSDILTRAKIGSFIPAIGDRISLFDYGLRSRFDRYLRESIDIPTTPDIDTMIDKISKDIDCEINISIGGEQIGDCSNR